MHSSARALIALAAAVRIQPPSRPPAHRLARAARDVLRADGVSLSVLSQDGPRLVVDATDRTARELEAAEEILGVGPAHLAAEGADVIVDPAVAPAPWANLATELLGRPRLPWVAAVPLLAGGQAFGALLAHARGPGPLAQLGWPHDIAVALSRQLLTLPPHTWLDIDGGGTATSRAVGMLMARHRTDASTSLALLRARALAAGQHLDATARQVLGSRGPADPF